VDHSCLPDRSGDVHRLDPRLMASKLEDALALQIMADGLPVPVREFACIPGRKFRFDFGFPQHRLLVECQGAVWTVGAHSTGAGISRDAEKASLAAANGYRLIIATGKQIKSGEAIKWIRDALFNSPSGCTCGSTKTTSPNERERGAQSSKTPDGGAGR